MNSSSEIPRTAKRTWAKLSETQQSVLEDAGEYDCDGGVPFSDSRLRTARSLDINNRGLLIEHALRGFSRTRYGQDVIDWKNTEKISNDSNK